MYVKTTLFRTTSSFYEDLCSINISALTPNYTGQIFILPLLVEVFKTGSFIRNALKTVRIHRSFLFDMFFAVLNAGLKFWR